MVRASGQAATSATAASIGATNSQAMRARCCSRVGPALTAAGAGTEPVNCPPARRRRISDAPKRLPVAIAAQPLQLLAQIDQARLRHTLARQRAMNGTDKGARDLVVAPAGHGRGPCHRAVHDREEILVE